MSELENSSNIEMTYKLLPLTAEFIDKEHEDYVDLIKEAIADKKIRNIALSGNYGSGKSSILKKVSEYFGARVVEFSLSTLRPKETESSVDSTRRQATKTTNRIQQEIVKQLLYREEPNKMQGSRFRRIERFNEKREILIALFIAIAASIIFALTGWTSKAAFIIDHGSFGARWPHAVCFVLAAIASYFIQKLLHGRIHIRQVSAGSATVTLNDKSVSFFDEYLDEIVYFFEMSNCNIVIFEDIDRFGNSYIFETLKSLNSLLNSTHNFIKADEPIRFIYAVKDSIFEPRKSDSHENNRDLYGSITHANRTKFFDIIIPVVPFITHRNARNLVAKILSEANIKVKPKLIDITAKYAPEMRLLKNIRNEFLVFKSRIFSGDGEKLRLDQSELFAMMLYKSMHLKDFEEIRIGNSNLDKLYAKSRELISKNIRSHEQSLREKRQQLKNNNDGTSRGLLLGMRLESYIKKLLHLVARDRSHLEYAFNNTRLNQNDLTSKDFWISVAEATPNALLTLTNSSYHERWTINFSKTDLKEILNDTLDPKDWAERYRKELNTEINEEIRILGFLRRADMSDLINHPEFKVTYIGMDEDQSLEFIADELLPSSLAMQLVREGFISRNYTLYTSTFYGNLVSTAATNFIIHQVEKNLMDANFELTNNDVDSILQECSTFSLREQAFYNTSILNRLLNVDISKADIIIESLTTFGDVQRLFIQTYLDSGQETRRFIQRLARVWPRIFLYLINEAQLEDNVRIHHVDTALISLNDEISYRLDSDSSAFLRDHYLEFSILKNSALGASEENSIARLFSDADVKVPSLIHLSKPFQKAFISSDLYEVNYSNLTLISGSDAKMSLNSLLNNNERAYKHIIKNINSYLAATDGKTHTITNNDQFLSILNDTIESDEETLELIIKRASKECVVKDISEAPEKIWTILAKEIRIVPTFRNIYLYTESLGLDSNISTLLSSIESINDHENVSDEEKLNLSILILNARNELPSPQLRSSLVAKLKLKDYIEPNKIHVENGDLFTLLVKDKVVADNETTYNHLSGANWQTREMYISASEKFISYMTPELIKEDATNILKSGKVGEPTKLKMIDQAAQYVNITSLESLIELSNYSTNHKYQLSIDAIHAFANNGVPTSRIIKLLMPHLDSINASQIQSILENLDEPYLSLAAVGYDKPTLPDTPINRAVLDALKRLDIVSSYTKEKDQIRVNKKYK